LALFLGLCRLGAILVGVNTRYRSSEVEYILRKSGARMLVMQTGFRQIDFAAILSAIDADTVPGLESIVVVAAEAETHGQVLRGRSSVSWEQLLSAGGSVANAAQPDDPCVLFITSGTTRGPKLIVHRQGSIVKHARDVALACRFAEPEAKLLAALPFCGVFGFCSAMAALAAGVSIHLLEPFIAEEAARVVRDERITHCFGSDEMFSRMLGAAGNADAPYPSARVFGFAAFHSGALEVARSAWMRGVPMLGLYGSSEVQALFALQDPALPQDERIVGGGRPVGGALAAVRVRDLETGELAPPGRSGELEMTGPGLFSGYFNDPRATADAMTADGFFRTGDLGRLRSDGSFVYEARIGDALRLGGYLVGPGEIEDVIKEMPGIADAQVVGVEIEGAARPAAFVIATAGRNVEPHAVTEHCTARLARFKIPARVWQLDAFPTVASPNGTKIQRAQLRQHALDLLRRESAHG
ncbi:MAG: AMP-binding protein, partial [Betaproteobacteria bacterium]|nr:AMP-binding protein [Betaproteobacteria bacterium]